MNTPRKIALLATGDEIINGDILNTNTQLMAQALYQNDMHPGMQLTTDDEAASIENAIRYLLEHHDALITIGGLGPTSDDRTRFALAKALDCPLVEDSASWEHVQIQLQGLGLNIPESNRQQALFPQGATIYVNDNGTANGCYYAHKHHAIFMLPGPPKECLSIFNEYVMPQLKELGFQFPKHKANWYLLGASEGHIADLLEAAAKSTSVQIGYRAFAPYLEIKLSAYDEKDFQRVHQSFSEIVAPYNTGLTSHISNFSG